MDEDPKSNVVPFPVIKDLVESGGPVSRAPFKRRACDHQAGYLVDAEEREVTCKRCGKVVDPFEALKELALHWDWARSRDAQKRAQQEASELLAEVERLKSKRSRLRASAALEVATVRRALADLVTRLRRSAHAEASRGDKGGKHAYEMAAYYVSEASDALLRGAGDA